MPFIIETPSSVQISARRELVLGVVPAERNDRRGRWCRYWNGVIGGRSVVKGNRFAQRKHAGFLRVHNRLNNSRGGDAT
jgi:hypothetical protein